MKIRLITFLALLVIALSGCATTPKIVLPPGSLTSWTHTDSYGPYTDSVIVTGVQKLPDGTFVLQHYDGRINVLGWGPHDVIEGLHVDGSGAPVAAPVKP